MEPSKKLEWLEGMKKSLDHLGAQRSDPHAWLAHTDKGVVFFVEIDHKKPEWNRYNHKDGIFDKRVGDQRLLNSVVKLRHSRELYDSVRQAYAKDLPCRVLLLKGTKSSKNPGKVKSALDGGIWRVTRVDGSVEQGYEFRLERIKPADS